MTHLKNHSLHEYTTLGIGGAARNLYIPDNKVELIELLRTLQSDRAAYYLLGAGSNLLVTDGELQMPVIALNKALAEYEIFDDGTVIAGASVDIRRLITDCANRGLRAPVELLTVPASVGGATFMNAGRSSFGVAFGQSVVEITAFDGKNEIILSNKACEFAHRSSIFHTRRNLTILSAKLFYPPTDRRQLQATRQKSVQAGADKCYRTQKSAGSVFKRCDFSIMKRLMGLQIGDAAYAPRTLNCILNLGEARYWQVMALVKIAQQWHRLKGRPCELEWDVWK